MPEPIERKRQREKRVVREMIGVYCRGHHGTKKGELCGTCAALAAYAEERSDKCPFMESKTFCSNCKVHCYKPDMRERIKDVMKWAGPRMIFTHPIFAIKHVFQMISYKRKLRKEAKAKENV